MINKLKFSAVLLIVFSVVFSSCLKDQPFLDVSNTQPIIEFGLGPSTAPLYLSYPQIYGIDTTSGVAPGVVDTAVGLVVASPQPLTYAVSVVTKVDTSVLNAYNAAGGSGYISLPDSLYSIVDTTSIAAGYIVGHLKINLNLPKISALTNSTDSFAIALSIVSAGNLIVSGNNSTFIWVFQNQP